MNFNLSYISYILTYLLKFTIIPRKILLLVLLISLLFDFNIKNLEIIKLITYSQQCEYKFYEFILIQFLEIIICLARTHKHVLNF